MDLLNCIHVSQMDFNKVNPEFFKEWIFKSYLICGFLLVLIMAPVYLYSYNVAEQQFKKEYPNEKVLHVVKTNEFDMFLITFFIGIFYGQFTPYLFFKNFYIEHIIYYIPFIIGSLIFLIDRFTLCFILSDKRIKLMCPFALVCKCKNIDIKYDDIESINSNLCIICKNKKKYSNLFASFKDMKKVKKIIEERMEARSIYE